MTNNPAEALREALGLGKKFDMEEALARAIFNDQHQGLQNCYDWDTAGLEDEHPGTTELYRGYAQSAIKTLAATLTSPAPAGGEVPADVAELVIAARIVAFEDQSPEALRALDKASEAFAERVPWENDPEAPLEPVQELHELPPDSFPPTLTPDEKRIVCREAATLLEALSAEKGRRVEALEEIARQKLADSMSSQDWADANFEEAYDCCVRRARTALTPKEKA